MVGERHSWRMRTEVWVTSPTTRRVGEEGVAVERVASVVRMVRMVRMVRVVRECIAVVAVEEGG